MLLVVFISPCAYLIINRFLYCADLLNAKYALTDDMACLLGVTGTAWFPINIIIHLSVITVLTIYFLLNQMLMIVYGSESFIYFSFI